MKALEQVSPKPTHNLTTSFDRGASILSIKRPKPNWWEKNEVPSFKAPSRDIIHQILPLSALNPAHRIVPKEAAGNRNVNPISYHDQHAFGMIVDLHA